MSSPEKAYSAALKLLNRRDYTEYEIYTKLINKEFNLKDVQSALARLTDSNFISDQRVAEQVVRFYQSKGNRWLKNKLKRRGIRTEQIPLFLEDNTSESERAVNVARKKWGKIKANSEYERTQKLAAFLAGRGFSMEVCWKIAKQVKQEFHESTDPC